MKIKICTIILLLCAFSLYAQADKDSRKVQLADGSFVLPDKYPEVTKHVKPIYPRQAILQDLQGKVFVKVTINETGKVEGVKIAQGINSSLDKAAMAAAKKMEFTPAVYQGKAVKVSIAIPVNFILDPEKQGPKISMIGPPPSTVMEQKYAKTDTVNIGAERKLIQKAYTEDPDPSSFIPVEKNPEPIQLVKPYYPEIAVRAGLTGIVILRVLVSKEGKPIRTLLIKTENDIFVEPAKKAAMETLFTPAIQNGKPIMCWLNIPFRFSLNKENELGKSEFNCEIFAGAYKYYPKEFSDRFIEGQVKLRVNYSTDGRIVSSEYIENTNTILDQKALDFVKEAMQPKKIKNGIPKIVDGKEIYEFTFNVSFGFGRESKFVINSDSPDFPGEARNKNIEGLIEIEYTYNKEGKLFKTNFLKKTNTILDDAAMKFFKENIVHIKSVKKYFPAGENELKIVVVKAVEFKLKK